MHQMGNRMVYLQNLVSQRGEALQRGGTCIYKTHFQENRRLFQRIELHVEASIFHKFYYSCFQRIILSIILIRKGYTKPFIFTANFVGE